MLNIVVVEDYDILREELVFHLCRPKWQVTGVGDGAELDRHLAAHNADIVVLDLNLPGEDGISIAQRLRQQHPGMALIMLTARGSPAQRAAGFTSGADVYLSKPAQTTEIEAVICNLEKRLMVKAEIASPGPLSATLDKASGMLTLPEGQRVCLSEAQMQLLQVLSEHHPRAIDLGTLCEVLGESLGSPQGLNQLRVQISRLRSKWLDAGGRRGLIEAVHGVGYRLTEPITCTGTEKR